MDDDEICYECSGYGDDYFINDDGELECYCPYCSIYRHRMDALLDDDGGAEG